MNRLVTIAPTKNLYSLGLRAIDGASVERTFSEPFGTGVYPAGMTVHKHLTVGRRHIYEPVWS
jgi:hypothetical protein